MREQGTVKFFDPSKGWGFIQREDGPDLFLHIRNLPARSYPLQGDKIEFEVGNDSWSGRPLALNARILAATFN